MKRANLFRRCLGALSAALVLAGCANPPFAPAKSVMTSLNGTVRAMNVVANNGGTLISDKGSTVTSYGGGVIKLGPSLIGKIRTGSLVSGAFRVLDTSAFAPVQGAIVVAQTLDGTVLGQATSDAQGGFTIAGIPEGQFVTLRTVVQTADKRLYLSGVADLDGGDWNVQVDPINTLIETKVLELLATHSPATVALDMPLLKGLWQDVFALNTALPQSLIDGTMNSDQLEAYYDQLAQQHPELAGRVQQLEQDLGR